MVLDTSDVQSLQLTDNVNLVCAQHSHSVAGGAVQNAATLCENNYSGIARFSSLLRLSFRGLWLCRHKANPNGARTWPLPILNHGILAAIAMQLDELDMSQCGLCTKCIEEMHLEVLNSVRVLHLACNDLSEFPLPVAYAPELEELYMQANTHLDLQTTETRLRQLQGEWPVMRKLKTFVGSYCNLRDTNRDFFSLMPVVSEVRLAMCAMSQCPRQLLQLYEKGQIAVLDLHGNLSTFSLPNVQVLTHTIDNLNFPCTCGQFGGSCAPTQSTPTTSSSASLATRHCCAVQETPASRGEPTNSSKSTEARHKSALESSIEERPAPVVCQETMSSHHIFDTSRMANSSTAIHCPTRVRSDTQQELDIGSASPDTICEEESQQRHTGPVSHVAEGTEFDAKPIQDSRPHDYVVHGAWQDTREQLKENWTRARQILICLWFGLIFGLSPSVWASGSSLFSSQTSDTYSEQCPFLRAAMMQANSDSQRIRSPASPQHGDMSHQGRHKFFERLLNIHFFILRTFYACSPDDME